MGAARILRSVLAGLFALVSQIAFAQSGYPSKAVRFIAPFPPGGATDTLCRLLAQKLSDGLGQPVTVDNRPGASGNIGHELAMKAPPDGYTLLLTNSSTLTTNPHLKSLPWTRSPISCRSRSSRLRPGAVVHPSVPAASVAELVALAGAARPAHSRLGRRGHRSHQRRDVRR
jgi:tripartite-type tricarboxylate transporter receptor subunit TctC